jgi:uncharacterized DUF497 family protein
MSFVKANLFARWFCSTSGTSPRQQVGSYKAFIQAGPAPDSAKRDKALARRGVDFANADRVFAGRSFTAENDRRDYGGVRFITVCLLHQRMSVMVWTPRCAARRIII